MLLYLNMFRTCLTKTRGKPYECYQTEDTLFAIPIIIPMTLMFPIPAITLITPIPMMMSMMTAMFPMAPTFATMTPLPSMGAAKFMLLELKILGKLLGSKDLFNLKV